MKKTWLLAVLVLVAGACGRPNPTQVAVYDGGAVTLADVERVLLALPVSERMAAEKDIVEGYRAVARRIALTALVVPETADPLARQEFLRNQRPELYRQSIVRMYFAEEMSEPGEFVVTDEVVEAYYREHPEEFVRPPRRHVHHIFRRADEDGSREEARRVIEGLRARVASGDDFGELAREFSESETREAGGDLGWIGRGLLPAELEAPIFALQRAEASRPIEVPGGVALFFVSDSVEEKVFTFEDVRREIRQALVRRKIDDALVAALEGIEFPPDATVLDRESLTAVMSSGADEDLVFSLETESLNRGELRQIMVSARQTLRGRSATDLGWRTYQRIVAGHVVFGEAESSGFLDRPDVRHQIDDRLKPLVDRALVDERIQELIRGKKDQLDFELRIFFEENRRRYQSPLQYKVRALVVRELSDPAKQMRQLVDGRAAVIAGDESLDQLAARTGGRVSDAGWIGFPQLGSIDPKTARFLVDLEPGGYSVPYRTAGALQIVHLVERRDPEELSYDAVRDRVVADFIDRFRDRLYEETVAEVLDDAGYRFLEENVRRVLDPPDPVVQTSSPSPVGSE